MTGPLVKVDMYQGSCKVRNGIETKQNETKQNMAKTTMSCEKLDDLSLTMQNKMLYRFYFPTNTIFLRKTYSLKEVQFILKYCVHRISLLTSKILLDLVYLQWQNIYSTNGSKLTQI